MQSVEIDQNKCIGCGMCESTCPEVFRLGQTGESTLTEEYREEKENVGGVPDSVGCVSDAKENCPVGAISVE